jgi:predicted Rossmann fold flavoprotein
MKIAIIGAGASGIIAAIIAKRENPNVHIDMFDANKSVGKKILASGNGRCNISNKQLNASFYLGQNPSFVEYALEQFSFKAFEKFCKSIGLLLDIKEDAKVYPLSNESKSVVHLLSLAIQELGVNLYLDTFVEDIQKSNDAFSITTCNAVYKGYDKVLISSGLAAAPQLNASEKGVEIAVNLGHTVNITYPSLVGLHTDVMYHTKLQGVKKECQVNLYINKQLEQTVLGDVLFTKYGVSGFAILDVSQYASYYLSLYQDVHITLNFFPKINANELADKIQSLLKNVPEQKVVDVLTGMISNKIAPLLLELCHINSHTKANELSIKQIKAIAHQLNAWKLKITDTQGFKHAEASGGGIQTNELDSKTYESKLVSGLYFAGEVLDIVGKRGGYNLHFAWASGYLAGQSLAKK